MLYIEIIYSNLRNSWVLHLETCRQLPGKGSLKRAALFGISLTLKNLFFCIIVYLKNNICVPAYYLISLCLFRYLVIIFSEAMLTEGYRSSNNNFTDMSYRLKTEFDIFSGGCEICWGIRDNWVVHTCLFYFIAACAILSKNSSSHSKCSANTSSHILKKSFDLKIYFYSE